MGQKSTCCFGLIKDSDFIDNEYKNTASSSKQFIKLQAIIRGHMIRKKLKIKNKISSYYEQFNLTHVPGQILDSNKIPISNNIKVIELEKLLDPFKLTEQEQTFVDIKKSQLRLFCLKYNDYSIYRGTFNRFWQREGYGLLVRSDGSKYEGFFKEDMMHGRGRLISCEGYCYEGEFRYMKIEGFGKYLSLIGSMYVGYWKNDKQHGYGEEVSPDGSKYEGNYLYGQKNGKGKFSWSDGSVYEGDFVNNNIEGNGYYKWKDGRFYNGQWLNNRMNGRGMFVWPDKRTYIGYYKNDKKEGFGIMSWQDKKRYEGDWVNGKQEGIGLLTDDQEKKYGEWKSGKPIRWLDDNNSDTEKKSAIMYLQSKINEFKSLERELSHYDFSKKNSKNI